MVINSCELTKQIGAVVEMSKLIIEKVRDISEEACKKETNIFGYGIWSHHIIYVVKYSKLMAEKLGADEEIVEIAALLHDYASIKNADYIKDHHIYGAQEAEKILMSLNYPSEKIEKVKDCIFSHRASVIVDKCSAEDVCVASADAMAHIDQVVSLLYSIYVNKEMGIEEGKEWVRNKIKRSWKKIDPVGKEIIRDKYTCALSVLE